MRLPDLKILSIAAYGRMLGIWVVKGGLSILDLVIYSGSMFLMSVLLARWLSVEDYGIFAIAMVFTTLFFQIQNSLILEPMNVIGPSLYPNSLSWYLSRQRIFHFAIFTGIGLVIILSAFIFESIGGDPHLVSTLIIVGLLAAFLQLPWMIRRSFYMLGEPFSAVLYSIIFAVVTIGVLFYIEQNRWITPGKALIIMAVGGLISAGFLYFRLNQDLRSPTKSKISEIWRENWGFGRWMLLTGIFIVLANQGPIILTGMLINSEASGVIKVLQNFMLPMGMIISTIIAIAIPNLAREYGRGDFQLVKQKMRMVTILLVSMAAVYALILALFATPLEYLLYHGKYAEYSFLIPLWGLIPLLTAAAASPSIQIRLFQRPQGIFRTAIIWMLVTILTCVLFTRWWGLLGASLSAWVGYAASTLAYFLVARKMRVYEKHNL